MIPIMLYDDRLVSVIFPLDRARSAWMAPWGEESASWSANFTEVRKQVGWFSAASSWSEFIVMSEGHIRF
jgi:hypothetical protein